MPVSAIRCRSFSMASSNLIVDLQISDSQQFRVQIGREVRTGDLYYLGIDPRNRDFDCPTSVGLVRLIDGWIRTIESAAAGRQFYLPFDFSDEFTRWFACEKSNMEITVVGGWADVEGWAISPSDFSEHSECLQGFRPDEPLNPQTFYTPRFLSELRRSRSLIGQSSS